MSGGSRCDRSQNKRKHTGRHARNIPHQSDMLVLAHGRRQARGSQAHGDRDDLAHGRVRGEARGRLARGGPARDILVQDGELARGTLVLARGSLADGDLLYRGE